MAAEDYIAFSFCFFNSLQSRLVPRTRGYYFSAPLEVSRRLSTIPLTTPRFPPAPLTRQHESGLFGNLEEIWKSGGDLTRAKMLASPLSPGETPLTFGPGLPHLEGERRGRWGKVWPVCTRPTSIQISECENEVSSLLLALRKNFTPALRPVPSCYGRI